ncbi:MAG: hypothetical protein ABL872_12730 [Lacibacter sp.]
MKKYLSIIAVILILGAVGGWFYWQQNKKSIIKDSIKDAVSKGTDSLYYIHYDSSFIDEINGNASFYNVTLQSDSLQAQLLLFDTASATSIYNVRIDEVTVTGANIKGLLSNTFVEANTILIKHPVVYIINSGKKEEKKLNSNDSLAIYEKLLGKFTSINANSIIIENGYLNFTDKTGEANTALRNINIQLKKFRIDSTKNFQNILSYFVKDVVAKVNEVYIKGDKNEATFSEVEYNAPGKFMHLKKFQQKNSADKIVFDINNTTISNISTNAFIMRQQLQAEELTSDGGMLTFYMKQTKSADSAREEIEMENNYFDEAVVNKVSVGNTKILIYNKAKPGKAPITINNVKFSASDIQKLHSGTNIKNLISSSNWKLSGDGFSFLTENKIYKMSVGAFDINNTNASMRIRSFTLKPQLSEAVFSKRLTHEKDLFNLEFNNIVLNGINVKMLITQLRLEAATATVQPVMKIYRDKTIADDMSSKVGNYPHQLLQTIKFPLSIKKLHVKNGIVTYTEKSFLTKQTASLFFSNVNGTVSNITNIKDIISSNSLLVVDVNTSFMGVSPLHTVWKLSLNNGNFDVSGTAGGFNAESLNPVIGPLGMAAVKTGTIDKLTFSMTGDDLQANGTATLLYSDLKIEMLKKDSNDVKKDGFKSFLANAMMRNGNPTNGVTRTDEIKYERDKTKSFFHLLWQGVFSAVKKTVQKM